MKNNYLVQIETGDITNTIHLNCTLRQANKVFISLSFALSGNVGVKKLSLILDTKLGQSVLNVARFTGVQFG